MHRLNLVFSDEMTKGEEPGVFVYTAFNGKRRYVEDTTVQLLGKERRISIIPNAKLWKAYQHYRKQGDYPDREFYDVQFRELDSRFKGAFSLDEVEERVAVLGLPYHRFAKSEESIEFFFAFCEKIIADLLEWYSRVIFVPPRLSPRWEGKGLLDRHNRQLRRLQSSFRDCELEVYCQENPH